jgi:hypothetical protein
MLVRRRNAIEVGWFGSKLVKSVGKGLSSVAKVVSKVPGVSAITAPVRLVSDVARGKNVVKSIGRAGSAVVADARKSLPIAAQVVSFVPGVGTAVGAGLSGAAALSQGKSLAQIGQAAALGAIPGGQLAKSALSAGYSVAKGGNVLKSVGREGLNYAASQIPGGAVGQSALRAAQRVASGGNVLRSVAGEGVALARSQVPGGAIANAALGTAQRVASGANVVKAVKSGGLSLAKQQGSQLLAKATPTMIRPSFGQPQSVSPQFIGRARSIVGLTRPSLQQRISPKNAKASFRPLAQNTRAMLLRAVPHMAGEVSGLSANGGQWIVEKGDTGSKIALKLTGNANRWTELRSVNPKIMSRPAADVKKYGFPVYVGDLVNLPASWIKVTAQTPAQSAPATASPAKPPAVQMPGGDIAAQGQARVILAAWGKSDGLHEGALPDYGGASELSATTWTARDVLQANEFANWWRRFGGPPAVADGNWSDPLSVALNEWAQGKATQVSNSALSAGGAVIPQITATPASPTPSPLPAQPAAAAPSVLAPVGSTPTLAFPTVPTISLPTLTIGGNAPISTPSVVIGPTPTAGAQAQQQAAATPTQGSSQPMSDNTKWALGSAVISAVGAGLVKTFLVR